MEDKSSVWMKIYRQLKKDGFLVYSPGQYTGECKRPYVVLSEGGSSVVTGVSSVAWYYDVMCYVPLDSYSMLGTFVEEVKEEMKKLFPMVRHDGVSAPSTLDDDLKAYMMSVEYVNYRKMNFL